LELDREGDGVKRERRDVLKDMARRYAQGVIENLELIWRFEDVTQEEMQIMQNEVDAIAKRIGKIRKFVDVGE
jgi:hypothetical protein